MKYKIVHHCGAPEGDPYKSVASMTAQGVNELHRQRWPDFKSSLGWYGGYNYFIEKDGKITRFRAVGEETAAVAGHNFDAIHYCLAGNFTRNLFGRAVDVPTSQQIQSLVFLLDQDYQNINIVLPHRYFQPTQCYGTFLADDWAKNLYLEYLKKRLDMYERMLYLYLKLMDLLKKPKLGSLSNSCLWENNRDYKGR